MSNLSTVMKMAWEIARQGQSKFGGKVREYFSCALKMAWATVKPSFNFSKLVERKFPSYTSIASANIYKASKALKLQTVVIAAITLVPRDEYVSDIAKNPIDSDIDFVREVIGEWIRFGDCPNMKYAFPLC